MGWGHLQVQANRRLELFANLLFTDAKSSISGLNYDPGALAPLLVGLDYRVMSSAFSGFSDLSVQRTDFSLGANHRLSEELILKMRVDFSQYDDRQPYLFDSTGRYVSFAAGLNWVF